MKGFKLVVLPTDFLVYVLVIAIVLLVFTLRRSLHFRTAWVRVISQTLGFISLIILLAYSMIGFLDCIHFERPLSNNLPGDTHYSTEVSSVLDWLISPLGKQYETTYSAPLAIVGFTQEAVVLPDGTKTRAYLPLLYAGRHLASPNGHIQDILLRVGAGLIGGLVSWILIALGILFALSRHACLPFHERAKQVCQGKTTLPWRAGLITLGVLLAIFFVMMALVPEYHLLGTNKVGADVFYDAIKSIRTGLLIGSLTTLVMLPFAVLLGTMAGYFGRLTDDIIQYIYITLSSIPSVLLVVAAVLSLQIFIDNHPLSFQTMAGRADMRLLALCIILGITSWTGLCRILRAETLKIRELDYVQAGKALGTPPFRMITQHILPNVFHLILISVVLDFSALVLAEAVLTYVGVGVDPSTYSWGNMIDSARLELARDPIIWWPLTAAFIFMFTLVLVANLFADAIRNGFDPRHS